MWLQSKNILLARTADKLTSLGKNKKGVICPVPTCWTAYYLAYKRLIKLRQVLELPIFEDAAEDSLKKFIVTGNAAAKLKAVEMIGLI